MLTNQHCSITSLYKRVVTHNNTFIAPRVFIWQSCSLFSTTLNELQGLRDLHWSFVHVRVLTLHVTMTDQDFLNRFIGDEDEMKQPRYAVVRRCHQLKTPCVVWVVRDNSLAVWVKQTILRHVSVLARVGDYYNQQLWDVTNWVKSEWLVLRYSLCRLLNGLLSCRTWH